MTHYTASATTETGVKVTVNWTANMVERSADGHVYGEEFVSYKGSIDVSKDGQEVITARDMIDSYPDMPANAAGVLRGKRGGKEIVQPISKEVYDLVKSLTAEVKQKAESDFQQPESDVAEEEKTIVNPAYAHMTADEIKTAERNYDAVNNEGAEGYNPYRDNLYVTAAQ